MMDDNRIFVHRHKRQLPPRRWAVKKVKKCAALHPNWTKPEFRRKILPLDLESQKPSDHETSTLQNLFSSSVTCQQRIVALMLLLICTIICSYQLYDRLFLYFSEPTTVNVIVNRNDSITFPSITFCSPRKPFMEAIRHHMQAKVLDKGYTFDKLWYISLKNHSLDMDQLWKAAALNTSSLKATVTTKMSTSHEGKTEPFPGKKTNVITAYCNCVTFTPENLLKLKGKTYVNIEVDQWYILRNSNTSFTSTTLYYKFHDAGEHQEHESNGYDDAMPTLKKTSVTIRIQKFAYQNKVRFRCEDEIEADAKLTRCIDDALRKAEIPCRFPFINSRRDLKPCPTLNNTWHAINRIYDVYDEEDAIKCHKKKQICRETVYDYPTPIHGDEENERFSYLTIVIPDNTFLTVDETFTYSFSALLSDVGGSLGFFLGMSVITLLNSLQDLARKFGRVLK